MGRALRSEQFDPAEISMMHCVQRCVRRAYLAGVDPQTGKDYGFRREWIRRRMEALASVFGVDVLTYAILSNHMHLILRNRPDVVQAWSDQEVAIRWLRVFPGRRLEEHLAEPTENDVATLARDKERLAEIRHRLSDLSWFMRALSEPIARMANKQDECTGRFWEGRFKAQAIADEAGLLACAMYVDLNPVRAAMAETPDQAPHTSAYDRIKADQGDQIDSAAFDLVPVDTAEAGKTIRETPVEALKERRKKKHVNPSGKRIRRDGWLAPFRLGKKPASDPELSEGGVRASDKGFLDLDWGDYLKLLRWTAKQSDEGSGREVPEGMQSVLTRLGIDLSMWRDLVWNFKRYFGQSCCAGSPSAMGKFAESTGRHWSKGQRSVAQCFAA
ncbi:hypothetical protein Mal15_36200 [Stieleria maiorica]|uniref:Transposase IS200-like domain-containing protein n=1 Tax=Stieleria maiorica TaxID=2795974 RepID=A0A5B9MIW8_9BACT|nr:transposase [Stieleria maiorica]QEF99555.1 hypothetical protein Mal15_36200 [Stieleria maiorica]